MIPLLIGLGALIGGVLLVTHWSEIVDWLEDFLPKLKKIWDTYKSDLPHAAVMYGDLAFEAGTLLTKIMHKLYYQDGDQWMEETTTRKINADQVPDYIKKKLGLSGEVDITSEIEEQLKLEV